MNQNIISFKMFVRNIFSDGIVYLQIICYSVILAAIYRFVFPLDCTALSNAKGFQSILSDTGFIPCNYVSLYDLLRFGLSGIG